GGKWPRTEGCSVVPYGSHGTEVVDKAEFLPQGLVTGQTSSVARPRGARRGPRPSATPGRRGNSKKARSPKPVPALPQTAARTPALPTAAWAPEGVSSDGSQAEVPATVIGA